VAPRRSAESVKALQNSGFPAIQYSLGNKLSSVKLKPLFESELIILNIPSGRKSIQADFFTTHMVELLEAIATEGDAQLIFISTTSVYGDKNGNITEQSPLSPTTDSGKAHVKIEQFIGEKFGARACVLRLAGLVGKDRHPAKYLAGRTGIPNGKHPVNLIHQFDVINAIQQIINLHVWGETLHLCSTEHPSREEYYSWAVEKLGLQSPEFLPSESGSTGKLIDANWTLQKLGLILQYRSPFHMFD
jgi:nucleoside-diphosphate-sugar epimerase